MWDAPHGEEDTVDVRPVDPTRLVAELWQGWPPMVQVLGGDDSEDDGPIHYVADLRRSLAAIALAAMQAAVDGSAPDRSAARLLGETALVLHDALVVPDTAGALATPRSANTRGAPPAGRGSDDATPWVDRLRFARMERWLAARAEGDADAEPSASLCLWVNEHLEIATPVSRRILPP